MAERVGGGGGIRSGGGGGGGSGTQKCVYQKWPDRTFPTVNFAFSHDGHFGLGEGGGGSRGGWPAIQILPWRGEGSVRGGGGPWVA